MKGFRRVFRKRALLSFLAFCMAFGLTACGAGSYKEEAAAMDMAVATEAAPMEPAAGFYAVPQMEETVAEEAIEEELAAEAPMEITESGSTDSGELEEVSSRERKLIKTVDMNVETRNYDDLLVAIENQVTALGGYIERMDTYNGSTYSGHRDVRDASMTLRIPKERLDSFLSTVSEISNVVRRSEYVEDVTLAYVDLESHRDALRTEQERLLELLEKAESVEDIITIESRLSDVRYQLESMESQLRTYDNQVDYSTVYLYIQEVEIYTPVKEDTVGQRIASGFRESLINLGRGFVNFGVWFVVNIPYLIVWAIILAVIAFLLVWLIRRLAGTSKRPKKEKKRKNHKTAGEAPAEKQEQP